MGKYKNQRNLNNISGNEELGVDNEVQRDEF